VCVKDAAARDAAGNIVPAFFVKSVVDEVNIATTSAAPSTPAADPRTELLTRVREEAKAQLETYRNEVVSQCWPAKGLPKGARTATLTVNVTFDAQGHEIARGISEDRRAPAGEFGRCVRNLNGITLGISPPGSNVAVSIPVSYP
jgi:hypothetical protein